jgi:hypothetical protein
MELKTGCIVSIKHYSGINHFRSIVVDINDNIIKLRLTKGFAASNFFEGDPLVLGYDIKNEVYVCECEILSLNTSLNIVEAVIIESRIITDKRSVERYPVSLYGDVYNKDNSSMDTILIKNISSNGMSICSKMEYEIGKEMEFSIYIDNTILDVVANIIWKLDHTQLIEYGLVLKQGDIDTHNAIQQYIEILIDEQLKIVNELSSM